MLTTIWRLFYIFKLRHQFVFGVGDINSKSHILQYEILPFGLIITIKILWLD